MKTNLRLEQIQHSQECAIIKDCGFQCLHLKECI